MFNLSHYLAQSGTAIGVVTAAAAGGLRLRARRHRVTLRDEQDGVANSRHGVVNHHASPAARASPATPIWVRVTTGRPYASRAPELRACHTPRGSATGRSHAHALGRSSAAFARAEAFLEQLAGLPLETWGAECARSVDPRVNATIAAIVSMRRLQLQRWFIRDLVDTALCVVSHGRPWQGGDRWRGITRHAAETAALSLLTMDELDPHDFEEGYAAFASAIPLASLRPYST